MNTRLKLFAVSAALAALGACARGERASRVDWAEQRRAAAPEMREYKNGKGEIVSLPETEVSTAHGFGLTKDGAKVAEIYTGQSLLVDGRCFVNDDALAKRFVHLDTYLDMTKLLAVYAPPGKAVDWFHSAFKAAEETDSRGINRPSEEEGPILANLKTRMGIAAINPLVWRLNAVRFRPRDVPMQIKINYEMSRPHAIGDRSISSAHVIHSISIPPALETLFKIWVRNVPQDEELSGCYIHNMLRYFLPRGAYFFWHANIFDTTPSVDQWIFYEAKVVKDDGSDDPIVAGMYDILPGVAAPEDVLRPVPMAFPYQRVVDRAKGTIEEATELPPLLLWKSGSNIDQFREDRGDLLVGPDAPYSDLEPARMHEATFTCGNCHIRRSSAHIDSATGKLRRVPSMVVRHIGFGDGRNCATDPKFGVPRAYHKASLSSYLLDHADAHAFYGMKKVPTKPYITPEKCLEPRFEITQTIPQDCTLAGDQMSIAKKLKFTMRNQNARPVPVADIVPVDGGAVVAATNTCTGTQLAVGSTCSFEVEYLATENDNTLFVRVHFATEEFTTLTIDAELGDNSCPTPNTRAPNVALTATLMTNCSYTGDHFKKVIRYKIRNNDTSPMAFSTIRTDENKRTADGGHLNNGNAFNSCDGAKINPTQSCQFDVIYDPAPTTGETHVVFRERSPLFDHVELQGSISGTSITCTDPTSAAPDVVIESTVMDDCGHNAGQDLWKTVRYKIRNNGGQALHLGNISAADDGILDIDPEDGGDDGEFDLRGDGPRGLSLNTISNCAWTVVDVGEYCEFDVSYRPAGDQNTTQIHVEERSPYWEDFQIGTGHGDNSCPRPEVTAFTGAVEVLSTTCPGGDATLTMRVRRTAGDLPQRFSTIEGAGATISNSNCGADKPLNEWCQFKVSYTGTPANAVLTLTDANGFYEPLDVSQGVTCQ